MTGVPVDGTGTIVTVVIGVEGISKTRFVPLADAVCVQPQIPTITNKNSIKRRYGIFMR